MPLLDLAFLKVRFYREQKGCVINLFLSILRISPGNRTVTSKYANFFRAFPAIFSTFIILHLFYLLIHTFDDSDGILFTITLVMEILRLETISRPPIN